jgi:hypothetical protein
MIPSRFPSVPDNPLCFKLIQWNPTPAPAMNPALLDDSSESNNYSPVPYGEHDALRFKAELEETQHELEDISKKVGIAELEWEDQCKQLLATIDGISLRFDLQSNPTFDTNHHCLATLQPAMPSLTS